MEDEVKIAEPSVDRWSAAHASLGRTNESQGSDPKLFSLSGGIMRQRVRTSSKIDGLLSRMMEHPEAGKYLPYPGTPYRLSESPCRIERRAPSIGEHNQLVYQMKLGLSPEEIEALSSRKVI